MTRTVQGCRYPDYQRPQLIDVGYRSHDELIAAVTDALDRVAPAVWQRVLERLQEVEPGDQCRLLLTGLPNFGAKALFESQAKWGAVLELADNSEAFRSIFNQFSAEGAGLSDPTSFLAHLAPAHGVPRDSLPTSEWRGYMEMLVSMFRAGQEVYGGNGIFHDQDHRPYEPYRSTSWLRYMVFHYRPSVPAALDAFLQECYNREATLAAYQATPDAFALVVKIPLPLDGYEAHLVGPEAAIWLRSTLVALRSSLLAAPPAERCGVLDAECARLPSSPLPLRLVARLEWFLPEEGFSALSMALPPEQDGPTAEAQPPTDVQPVSHEPEE